MGMYILFDFTRNFILLEVWDSPSGADHSIKTSWLACNICRNAAIDAGSLSKFLPSTLHFSDMHHHERGSNDTRLVCPLYLFVRCTCSSLYLFVCVLVRPCTCLSLYLFVYVCSSLYLFVHVLFRPCTCSSMLVRPYLFVLNLFVRVLVCPCTCSSILVRPLHGTCSCCTC